MKLTTKAGHEWPLRAHWFVNRSKSADLLPNIDDEDVAVLSYQRSDASYADTRVELLLCTQLLRSIVYSFAGSPSAC